MSKDRLTTSYMNSVLTLSSTRSFLSLSSGLGIASAMLIIKSSNVEQHTCPQRVISEIKTARYSSTFFRSNHLLRTQLQ